MVRIGGIDRFDIGIGRGGDLKRFRQSGLDDLDIQGVLKRLAWLRAENSGGGDIYFRPAGKLSWPIVFIDDLTTEQAGSLNRKYQCWTVETSTGRHHAWILTNGKPLLCWQRYAIQKKIVGLGWGDPGSISGDHFGRVPGFRNMKRNGSWVNLKSSPDPELVRLSPWGVVLNLAESESPTGPAGTRPAHHAGGERGETDQTPSGVEFGWCCGWLRKGLDPEEAVRRLTLRAQERGKPSPEKYARRTVSAAQVAIDSETRVG